MLLMAIAAVVLVGTRTMAAVADDAALASSVNGGSIAPLEIPTARRLPVPMAPLLQQHPRFEDAFAAAVAVAAERVAAERTANGGEAVRAVVELPPGRHHLTTALVIIDRTDIGIDGGSCTLVQTAWQSVFEIRDCRNVVISNLAIDYEPLPFTQGTVTAIDATGKTLDVKADAGYPSDAAFAARLARGALQSMDRDTESFAVGGRYAMQPIAARSLQDGCLRVDMAWGTNDLVPASARSSSVTW